MQPMHTRESTSIQVWHIDRLTFCLVPHRKMCLRRMNEKEKFEKWSAACDNAAINRPSIRHQSWSQKGNICGSRGHYRRHVTVSRSWSFKYANLTHRTEILSRERLGADWQSMTAHHFLLYNLKSTKFKNSWFQNVKFVFEYFNHFPPKAYRTGDGRISFQVAGRTAEKGK